MQLKHCSKCDGDLPLASFGKDKYRSDGLTRQCRACIATANKAKRERDPESVRLIERAYYARNRDEVVTRKKEWRDENPIKSRAASSDWKRSNPDQARALWNKWRRANPHKMATKIGKYRAARYVATPAWANRHIILYFYAVAYAESRATGVQHHVDHIVPLRSKIVCGLHNEFNLQVIPGPENCSKGNRHWPDMP